MWKVLVFIKNPDVMYFIKAFTTILLAITSLCLNAQTSISDYEKQAKIDSITAELEKQFGWNDAAYTPEIAYGKWEAGEASFLLQGGLAPVVYIGQENFKKKYGVDYEDFGCMAYCSEHQMKI